MIVYIVNESFEEEIVESMVYASYMDALVAASRLARSRAFKQVEQDFWADHGSATNDYVTIQQCKIS